MLDLASAMDSPSASRSGRVMPDVHLDTLLHAVKLTAKFQAAAC